MSDSQPPVVPGSASQPEASPPADAQSEKTPALPGEHEFGQGSALRNLDMGLEQELEAAMGGLSDTELYGDLSRREKKPVASGPGGRSQGVLPLVQFPEGPPAVGTEVMIHIERYDEANGLLLLSRQGAAVHA